MKKNLKLLLFSTALLIVGLLLALPEKIGLCEVSALDCIEFFSEKIAQPIILLSLPLIILLVISFFVKKEVFVLWSKFALVAIPLLVLWIILTPVTCGAALGVCLDKELVSWYASISFLIISLIIIIYKSLQIRSKIDLTK